MPLPNYINQARPQLTNQRWQNMRPQQRRRIGNQVHQQQANIAARAPAAAPAQDTSGPYTPPQQGQPAQTSDYPIPNGNYGGSVAPSDYANHPFFDPNNPYQTQDRPATSFGGYNQNDLGWMQYASEENPEGYYYALLNQQNLGGFDAKSQTAQAMFRDYARGYGAAKTTSPNLYFPEYMRGQNIQGTLGNMSYNQLGIDQQQWSDRTRWGMRGY